MLTRILVFLGLIVFSNHVIGQEVDSKDATKSQAELKAQDSAKTDADKSMRTVKLEKRTATEYGKSGFSFRYKTQDITKHKNYVDVVYEQGRMRINNHGGIKCRIADLGTEKDIKKANEMLKDAKWSDKLLPPVAGRTYALDIVEDKHKMSALFHVTKVDEKVMEFVWQPDPKKKWPVDLTRRGAAGCSGMMGGAPR